jgi:hypothetical protein
MYGSATLAMVVSSACISVASMTQKVIAVRLTGACADAIAILHAACNGTTR